jgi:hypothetical protein
VKYRQPWSWPHAVSVLLFQMAPDDVIRDLFELQLEVQNVMVGRRPGTVVRAARALTRLLAKSMRPSSLLSFCRQALGPRDEFQCAPILYPEHGSITHANAARDDRWLFSTVGLHDVVDGLRPASVDRLINEYGLHIAHTYLGSTSRAHLGHALTAAADGHWRLTNEFAENLRHIAQRQQDGDLWFAPVAEIGDHLAFQRKVRVVPEDVGRWQVIAQNPMGSDESASLQLVLIGPAGSVRIDDRSTTPRRLSKDAQIISLPITKDVPRVVCAT